MTLRCVVGLAFVATACTTPPPPIGTGDASTPDGAQGGDAATTDGATVDASEDGGDGGTCTLASPPSDPTCASCVESTCCARWDSCVANSDCTGYVACIRACYPDGGTNDGGTSSDGGEGGGFACASACQKQFPTGINDGIVVLDCEDNTCAGKCP